MTRTLRDQLNEYDWIWIQDLYCAIFLKNTFKYARHCMCNFKGASSPKANKDRKKFARHLNSSDFEQTAWVFYVTPLTRTHMDHTAVVDVFTSFTLNGTTNTTLIRYLLFWKILLRFTWNFTIKKNGILDKWCIIFIANDPLIIKKHSFKV